jgi:hypothetical protein
VYLDVLAVTPYLLVVGVDLDLVPVSPYMLVAEFGEKDIFGGKEFGKSNVDLLGREMPAD